MVKSLNFNRIWPSKNSKDQWDEKMINEYDQVMADRIEEPPSHRQRFERVKHI